MLKSDKWIRKQCETNDFALQVRISNEDNPATILFNVETYKNKLCSFEEYVLNEVAIFMSYATPEQCLYVGNYVVTRLPNTTNPMISPFIGQSIKHDPQGNKIPSYGLSSYGYDIRLGRNIKLYKKMHKEYNNEENVYMRSGNTQLHRAVGQTDSLIDPSNYTPDVYDEYLDIDEIILPPRGFILGHTVEYFNMPRRVMGICMGKSTLARCGVGVLVTPLEPGWSGYLTLEIVNHTELPVKLQTGTGICQINFLESDEDCETSYADRGGKYQNQPMIPVDPKV